ncbi:MAG: hypothetical protein CR993_07045 [Rhodobacterales bacterium]|nr:MAG: hypothetical protein CR993_07045 [Rhodobacterales bacterium]
MHYTSLDTFLAKAKPILAKGPIALLFIEDLVEAESTIRYHLVSGFRQVVIFAPPELELPVDLAGRVHRIRYSMAPPDALTRAVNAVIEKAPGQWLYYGFNAEYLFHPFCESRNVAEMLAFHAEERRDAMLTYVVDIYAGDLEQHPNAVALNDAWLDKSGYYALGRKDGAEFKERQLDFFGGLRWRFEEHIAPERRRIDRIALFRAKPGLRLLPDHRFNDEEYNTYACPWHNNITAAIASFRAAKALKTNAGSTFDIQSFKWHNSVRFEWNSQQLMDLGLMEPGQWF